MTCTSKKTGELKNNIANIGVVISFLTLLTTRWDVRDKITFTGIFPPIILVYKISYTGGGGHMSERRVHLRVFFW